MLPETRVSRWDRNRMQVDGTSAVPANPAEALDDFPGAWWKNQSFGDPRFPPFEKTLQRIEIMLRLSTQASHPHSQSQRQPAVRVNEATELAAAPVKPSMPRIKPILPPRACWTPGNRKRWRRRAISTSIVPPAFTGGT